jgi:hypothetical protein
VRTSIAIAVAALLACGTRATQEPCPGTVQAVFTLVAQQVEGGDACASATGATGPGGLTAAVTFTGDDGAAVCLQRPLAEPLAGTRAGDAIQVATPLRNVAASGCACTAQLRETITGTVQRDGGVAVGFSGELSTELVPADGAASCAPAEEGGTCVVPCVVRWTLSAG